MRVYSTVDLLPSPVKMTNYKEGEGAERGRTIEFLPDAMLLLIPCPEDKLYQQARCVDIFSEIIEPDRYAIDWLNTNQR